MEGNVSLASSERLVTYLDRKKRKRAEYVYHYYPQLPRHRDLIFTSSFTIITVLLPAWIPDLQHHLSSLPGPSPVKRARNDSEEPAVKAPTKEKKSTHSRSTSSVNLKQALQQVANTSPSDENKKPESVAARSVAKKPKSRAKSVAADDDNDDNASVADSVISNVTNSGKIRRSEAERIEYFKNQPECGTMDLHAVQCLRCGKSVNLGKKQTYAVRPWEIHRSRCDQKPAQNVPTTPAVKAGASVADALHLESSPIIPPTFFATPSAPSRPRLTEEQRKEFLENDKQIEKVEKHRVCCYKCHNWVDLSPTQTYSSKNWISHKLKCADAVPSNRVAAAKRKLLIVNDAQAKSFTPKSIECALCGTCVALEGEGDFNLTKWDEHKSGCKKAPPLSRGESINSPAFASRFSRPPASASSDGTLVASGSGNVAAKANPLMASPTLSTDQSSLKRSRDEFEASQGTSTDCTEGGEKKADAEERPSIRRKLSHMDFSWLMLPFQSLVRGFKDSLS
ncbi:hypothetical protein CVT24_008602 [Panaeolus cyanescens]|uniref:Uncharacterized protein n=1 Tax=Panaeolus cyanescens TaxID=181874 RepID=A0A409VB97_9AGAR|nr:hypothetical protein CVT24_008602 [Panaeolus cyanescens]